MTFRFLNRVRMSVFGAPGTGFVTLNSPAAGFQAFDSAGMSDGDTTPYLIEDGSPLGSTWEIGVGTWHSNGTFTRTTVTQSSAGGTTPISASSSAVISAIFRAGDLTGVGSLATLTDTNIVSPTNGQLLTFNSANSEWENHPPPGKTQPQVVQYTTIQTTTNPPNATLGAAPTVGNYLVFIANGGGGTVGSAYGAGFEPSLIDKLGSFGQHTQYDCNYAIRAVHPGDSAIWNFGEIAASGPTLNGVLVEVSGVDITRCSEFLMSLGTFGTSATALDALSEANALTLMFAAGDPQTITVTSPTPQVLNNISNGSSLVFAYHTSTGGFDGIVARIASDTLSGLVMSLPGV
jgi:hypothetical protein